MSGSGSERWARPAVILVATDLGDLDRLMPIALEQAGEAGARLILLHVLAASGTISTDAAGLRRVWRCVHRSEVGECKSGFRFGSFVLTIDVRGLPALQSDNWTSR